VIGCERGDYVEGKVVIPLEGDDAEPLREDDGENQQESKSPTSVFDLIDWKPKGEAN